MKVNNVTFTYAKGVDFDKDREEQMLDQINVHWFKPYIKRFNEENGVIEVEIGPDNKNNLKFSGISDELRASIDIYQAPFSPAFRFK